MRKRPSPYLETQPGPLRAFHTNQVNFFSLNQTLETLFFLKIWFKFKTSETSEWSLASLNSGKSPIMILLWLVHALQKSVWQQFQPDRAQLSSVVQPFSPVSVEEKRKRFTRVSLSQCNTTDTMQKPQKKQNSSEFSGDHTVKSAVPTNRIFRGRSDSNIRMRIQTWSQ